MTFKFVPASEEEIARRVPVKASVKPSSEKSKPASPAPDVRKAAKSKAQP